jgi:hypothetical protein
MFQKKKSPSPLSQPQSISMFSISKTNYSSQNILNNSIHNNGVPYDNVVEIDLNFIKIMNVPPEITSSHISSLFLDTSTKTKPTTHRTFKIHWILNHQNDNSRKSSNNELNWSLSPPLVSHTNNSITTNLTDTNSLSDNQERFSRPSLFSTVFVEFSNSIEAARAMECYIYRTTSTAESTNRKPWTQNLIVSVSSASVLKFEMGIMQEPQMSSPFWASPSIPHNKDMEIPLSSRTEKEGLLHFGMASNTIMWAAPSNSPKSVAALAAEYSSSGLRWDSVPEQVVVSSGTTANSNTSSSSSSSLPESFGKWGHEMSGVSENSIFMSCEYGGAIEVALAEYEVIYFF